MERNLWLADPCVTPSLLSKGHQWSLEDTENAVRSCQVTLSDSQLRAIKYCKPFILCRGENKMTATCKNHPLRCCLSQYDIKESFACKERHQRSEYNGVLPIHSFIPYLPTQLPARTRVKPRIFSFMLNVLEVHQLVIPDLTQIIFIGAPKKRAKV